jgi:hypothetical protein
MWANGYLGIRWEKLLPWGDHYYMLDANQEGLFDDSWRSYALVGIRILVADVLVIQNLQAFLTTHSFPCLLHCQLKDWKSKSWVDKDVAIPLDILLPAFEISVLPLEISRIDSMQPLANIAQDIIREAFFQQRK